MRTGPELDLVRVQRRLGLLHDWACELHGAAGEERRAIHERGLSGRSSDVLAEVEVAIGDWSTCAARIASGRTLKSLVGFRKSLESSLFARPEVAAFLCEESGFFQFRRYIESVEMLRLALLEYLDVVED